MSLPDEPPGISVDRFRGTADHAFILDELEPRIGTGAYAVLEAARDLDAWIELVDGETIGERENRRRLRTSPSEFAGEVPELRQVLPALLSLLRRPAPGEGEARGIAELALQVSAWAESLGAPDTAVAFAQLAQEADAEARPADPRFACELGRLASATPGHAEDGVEWLAWAALQARRLGRWEVAEHALRMLGDRAAAQGDTERGVRLHRLAGIAARHQDASSEAGPRRSGASAPPHGVCDLSPSPRPV